MLKQKVFYMKTKKETSTGTVVSHLLQMFVIEYCVDMNPLIKTNDIFVFKDGTNFQVGLNTIFAETVF